MHPCPPPPPPPPLGCCPKNVLRPAAKSLSPAFVPAFVNDLHKSLTDAGGLRVVPWAVWKDSIARGLAVRMTLPNEEADGADPEAVSR